VTPREYIALKQIEKNTKGKIKRKEIPSIDDIFTARFRSMLNRVKETLDKEAYKKFVPLAADLDDEYNLVDVAAALMHMVYNSEVSYDYKEIDKTSSDYVRLFMTAGRMDHLTPKQLLQFFNKKAHVDKESVGDIDIYNKFTFVDVHGGVSDSIIKNCTGKKICGRKVKIEISEKKQ